MAFRENDRVCCILTLAAIKKIARQCLMGLLLITLAAAVLPSAVSAQSVLKLFSTPAERAELERRRLMLVRPESVRVQVAQPVEVVELPTVAEEQVDVIISLGGSMLRADGTYTIWINGNPVNQGDLPDYMELLTPFSQGKLRIRNEQNGNDYEVKPGQVLNLTSGQLLESYEIAQMEPAMTSPDTESVTEVVQPVEAIGTDAAGNEQSSNAQDIAPFDQ